MKIRSSLILLLSLIFSIQKTILAQDESAFPFLLISPNPSGNGWGGVSTGVVSDNPTATISNPAQLGFFSLDNYFSASTFVPKTQWLPRFHQSDLTYNVSAINLGVNLSNVFALQLPVSFGMGYSRVYLNLGTFIRTTPSVETYEAWEKSESFSLGIGVDYVVRIGVGLNIKSIVSRIALLRHTRHVSQLRVNLDPQAISLFHKLNNHGGRYG